MKLDQLSGNVNLTYCTNIHAGESWPDIRASLDAHVPAIKTAVTPDRPLGPAELAGLPLPDHAWDDKLAFA